MFKWIGWLGRLIASALLLSFLCIWTTGYIVNSYVETLLKQMNIPLEVQPFALSGVWGQLWGAEEPAAADAGTESPEPGPAPGEKAATGSERGETGADPGPENGTGGGSEAEPPEPGAEESGLAGAGGTDGTDGTDGANEADGTGGPGQPPEAGADDAPASGGLDGEDGAAEPDTVPVIGEDEAIGAIQGLTDGERQELFSLVVSKLDSAQLRQMSGYLSEGVSAEELTELERMLRGVLDDDEFARMMELLGESPPDHQP